MLNKANKCVDVSYTYPSIRLLWIKLNVLLISILTISFLGVFEISKLNIVSVKACGTWMIDINWSLSLNTTIFTSAFSLHWLCNEALSRFSHQAKALSIFTGGLQTKHRSVLGSFFRSIEITFGCTFFYLRKHWIHHHLQVSWNFHFLTQLWFSLTLKHECSWISIFYLFEIVACIVGNFINHWTEKYYFHSSCLIFYNFSSNN